VTLALMPVDVRQVTRSDWEAQGHLAHHQINPEIHHAEGFSRVDAWRLKQLRAVIVAQTG
jgi:hypothetical protein